VREPRQRVRADSTPTSYRLLLTIRVRWPPAWLLASRLLHLRLSPQAVNIPRPPGSGEALLAQKYSEGSPRKDITRDMERRLYNLLRCALDDKE
jgi:hypothetical protein